MSLNVIPEESWIHKIWEYFVRIQDVRHTSYICTYIRNCYMKYIVYY